MPIRPVCRLVPFAALALAIALALDTGGVRAQPVARPNPRDLPHIEDNSFLAEEAFNQDAGVVQHISQFTQARGSRAWQFTFTQEWPVGGVLHQLSYTLPLGRGDTGSPGTGDLMLNYRYQLVANERGGSFVAPRVSVSVPTGDPKRGLGTGTTGVQVVVPVSQQLGEAFITHVDAGYTYFGAARDAAGVRGSLAIVNVTHSLVWLARPRFNVLIETVWTGAKRRSRGASSWDATLLLNPGVRWAYNFASGMQIVPGISFPVGVGPSAGEKQILLYFSVEHPFTRAARAAAK